MGQVLVGTSGWVYPDWAGRLYRGVPKTRWLQHYAERFPTVEVNATFYRLPTVRAVSRWREQVPPGFRFVVKGSRYLTHMKRLTDTDDGDEAVLRTGRAARRVPRHRPVATAAEHAPRSRTPRHVPRRAAVMSTRHAVEFRHASWQVTRDVRRPRSPRRARSSR